MPINESPDLTKEVNEGNKINKLIEQPINKNENTIIALDKKTEPVIDNDKQEVIEAQLIENIEKEVLLISRLDHPEYITYNGHQKRLSPRHRELVFESLISGDLPNGVQFIIGGTK